MSRDYEKDFRRTFAEFIKKIKVVEINDISFEGFLACRLVLLDQTLRRVAGKVVMFIAK